MVYLSSMIEMDEKVKEEEKKKKYRYYNINIWIIPEVQSRIEDVSNFFIREYVKELLSTPAMILSVPLEEAKEFFNRNGYILKRIHSNKELHDKWKALPIGIKKRLYYLVNKKLLEVLNDELRTGAPPKPS